jgi:ribosomal protein S18 acetylase RimI-like enzyme
MTESRYYLEILGVEHLRPPISRGTLFELRPQDRADPDLARWLYERVGEPWRWVDRLPWSRDDWATHVARPEVSTWVLWDAERPAGYFELTTSGGGSVEISYFGLLPDYVGRGLGGYLLTEAVRRAFALGAGRVWLHTCTRDHPHALRNYEARGFRVYKTEPL